MAAAVPSLPQSIRCRDPIRQEASGDTTTCRIIRPIFVFRPPLPPRHSSFLDRFFFIRPFSFVLFSLGMATLPLQLCTLRKHATAAIMTQEQRASFTREGQVSVSGHSRAHDRTASSCFCSTPWFFDTHRPQESGNLHGHGQKLRQTPEACSDDDGSRESRHTTLEPLDLDRRITTVMFLLFCSSDGEKKAFFRFHIEIGLGIAAI